MYYFYSNQPHPQHEHPNLHTGVQLSSTLQCPLLNLEVGIIFYPPKPHWSRGTEIEFWTTSKSHNRRFSEIVWMICTNNRTSNSHHSWETNRNNMVGILSNEPHSVGKLMRILDMFLRSKGLINSSESLKRDRRPSFPASKWTKILGTLVCI